MYIIVYIYTIPIFTNEDAENKTGIVQYTSDVLVLWEVRRGKRGKPDSISLHRKNEGHAIWNQWN